MAASAGEVLSEREEKRLSKLRERLFESNWDSAEFRASLRDLVSLRSIRVQSVVQCSANGACTCNNGTRAYARELGSCWTAQLVRQRRGMRGPRG